MFELIKVILLGIVEGITEWLPISSTGHLILVDQFVKLQQTPEFKEMFMVVIQLAAILAVMLIYFKKLNPFKRNAENQIYVHQATMNLWFKILVATIPAAIIGLLFDDLIDKYLYNPYVVAVMLISFGVGFIYVEEKNRNHLAVTTSLTQITYYQALVIGGWQVIAAIFPGTSRSGATILGAIMLGISRKVATEFTFFLAIPVMFGASLLKLVKFGFKFTAGQLGILLVGSLVAFVTSILAIKFLIGYLKKNDFTAFGYYRIGLGVLVLLFFVLKAVF